jgi:hypothetical protein
VTGVQTCALPIWLERAGFDVSQPTPAAQVIAITTRVPLAADALAALRDQCRALPTALIGLQNDAFLERVPEAALRLSAADATPLTRRVVAQRLAELRPR